MSRVDLQDWKEFTGQTGLGLTETANTSHQNHHLAYNVREIDQHSTIQETITTDHT